MNCSACTEAACCGKSRLQNQLAGALIGLARATEGNEYLLTASTAAVTLDGLRAVQTGENISEMLEKVDAEKRKLVPDCYNCLASCGRTDNYNMERLWRTEEDVRSLKYLILFGICQIAAGDKPDCAEESTHSFLYRALYAIGMEDWGTEELLPIVQEVGRRNGGWNNCPKTCISPAVLACVSL